MSKKGRRLQLKLAHKKVHDAHNKKVAAHKKNPEKSHGVKKAVPKHKPKPPTPAAKAKAKQPPNKPPAATQDQQVADTAQPEAATQTLQEQPAPVNQPVAVIPASPPFPDNESILLVGEGNFSFSSSLANMLGTAELITATAYDSQEDLHSKYPDAEQHTSCIQDLGGTVLYGVDATRLHKVLKDKKYHHIIFNFPHVGAGIKDQDANILTNQRLMAGFFASAKQLLASPHHTVYTSIGPVQGTAGQIHVTLKTGPPYDLWQITTLAKAAGLKTKACKPFKPDRFPGYEHRRTIGYDATKAGNAELQDKECKTWVFGDAKSATTWKGGAGKKRGMGGGAQGGHVKKRRQNSDSDSD